MAKPKVHISLLIDEETRTEAFGQALMDFMFSSEVMAPEYMSTYEPINNGVSTWTDAKKFWDTTSFFWRRKHSFVSEGSVFHTGVYGPGSIIMSAIYGPRWDWLGFFKQLITITRPSYGYLHLFSDAERADPGISAEDMQSFWLGAFAKSVNRGFLQLGWANYFGAKWLSSIDRETLQNYVASSEYVDDGFLFNITSDLGDVVKDYPAFSTQRRVARDQFASGVFRTLNGHSVEANG